MGVVGEVEKNKPVSTKTLTFNTLIKNRQYLMRCAGWIVRRVDEEPQEKRWEGDAQWANFTATKGQLSSSLTVIYHFGIWAIGCPSLLWQISRAIKVNEIAWFVKKERTLKSPQSDISLC